MTEPAPAPRRLVVWRGELATRAKLRARGLTFLAPAALWLLGFLVVPGLVLCGVAFMSRGMDGEVVWTPSLAAWRRLAGFGILGWSPDVLRILLRSVVVAGITTIAALALAYPLAFFIAGRGPRGRAVWLGLVVVPMCTNVVVRTYAWELLLSPGMPPARLLTALGLLESGRALYPTLFAVCLGMVSNALPFAVLPLYTNVERLDHRLIEAARDLYGAGWRVFRHAILPQTLPGLSVAAVLTFVPAVGMYVITDRLGGARHMVVGNLIQQQFGASRDYPFGAAVSLFLIALTLAGLALQRRLQRKPTAEPARDAP